ncbi:hypothetical protein JCM11641_003380 [Rhodosporidiobolus odoratus]
MGEMSDEGEGYQGLDGEGEKDEDDEDDKEDDDDDDDDDEKDEDQHFEAPAVEEADEQELDGDKSDPPSELNDGFDGLGYNFTSGGGYSLSAPRVSSTVPPAMDESEAQAKVDAMGVELPTKQDASLIEWLQKTPQDKVIDSHVAVLETQAGIDQLLEARKSSWEVPHAIKELVGSKPEIDSDWNSVDSKRAAITSAVTGPWNTTKSTTLAWLRNHPHAPISDFVVKSMPSYIGEPPRVVATLAAVMRKVALDHGDVDENGKLHISGNVMWKQLSLHMTKLAKDVQKLAKNEDGFNALTCAFFLFSLLAPAKQAKYLNPDMKAYPIPTHFKWAKRQNLPDAMLEVLKTANNKKAKGSSNTRVHPPLHSAVKRYSRVSF